MHIYTPHLRPFQKPVNLTILTQNARKFRCIVTIKLLKPPRTSLCTKTMKGDTFVNVCLVVGWPHKTNNTSVSLLSVVRPRLVVVRAPLVCCLPSPCVYIRIYTHHILYNIVLYTTNKILDMLYTHVDTFFLYIQFVDVVLYITPSGCCPPNP